MVLSIAKVESAKSILDIALRSARERASQLRTAKKALPKKTLEKARALELKRCFVFQEKVRESLSSIVKGFPSFEELAPFYFSLAKATLDLGEVKKSLGAANWARGRIEELWEQTKQSLRSAQNTTLLREFRTEFYGRTASVLKQIDKNLAILENARRSMASWPVLKTGVPSVVIAGYPNVGKSTLLKALTGSEPKIASYPFTTQQLMLGYIKSEVATIQVIDTPGLLDRPLTKRNKIELQAILALEHLANLILFVLDPSEVGYPIEKQHALLKEILSNFKNPVVLVINKTDLLSKESLEKEQAILKNLAPNSKIFLVSAQRQKGITELKEFVIETSKPS